MFNRILVPVDGSETSTRALVAALQLAREAGGQVQVVHALDELAYVSGYDYSAEVMRLAQEQAARVLQDAMDVAQASGVPCDSKLLDAAGQRLGDSIAAAAAAWQADLVVVGTHGRRGVSRVLLGSGAEQIIRTVTVPVLTIRGRDAAVTP